MCGQQNLAGTSTIQPKWSHEATPIGTNEAPIFVPIRVTAWLPSVLLSLGLLTTPAMAQTSPATQPTAQATQPAEAELPVRAVTLFSSGVGYFEHAGSVEGNANSVLRFKTEQINDLLKSLVIQDLDGGLVQAVTYPSNDPVERQLGSFQIDLSGEPTLANILSQLRGATITLDSQTTGTILGVESKTVSEGEVTLEKTFLNLFTGSGLKSLPVDTIGTFTLEDPKLQAELARALAALAKARDKDQKSVGFNFAGEGERRIRLGYVVEAPVWKTSYRLLLGQGDEESQGNLQGWAIVENQTDNDWSDVELSLVSGRPISFVMDLYQPLYVQRPVVVPELYQSLRPKAYDEGIATRDNLAQLGVPPEVAQRRAAGGFGGGVPAGAPAAPRAMDAAAAESYYQRPMDPAASIKSAANAADLGELFSYTVGSVDIARQSSAMIPIVTDPVEAEKVSIYNAAELEKHPLNGVILENTTGKHLLQGPITVFEDGGYAGDARVIDTPPGETRLISYGIDLKLNTQHHTKPQQTQLVTGKIVDGVLYLTRRVRTTHEYVFNNDTDEARTVILEHPYERAYSLIDTPEPYETTDTLRRFRLTAEPGRTDFTVTAETTTQERQQLTGELPPEQVLAWANQGPLPQEVRDALKEVARLQSQVAETQRQLHQVQEELAAITQEQSRIRENMRTVNPNSDYYKRLVTKLDEQETEIEQLQTRRDELQAQLNERQQALRDYLRDLDVG